MIRIFILLIWGTMYSAQAQFSTTNLLLNPGAEAGSTANWVVGGDSSPSVDNGTFDPGILPHTGAYDFYGHTGATGILSQVVILAGNQGLTAGAIDTGRLLANLSFWEQGLNQALTSDDAYISLNFLNASSNLISSAATPPVDSHNNSWANYRAFFPVPAGTRYIQYNMNFVRQVGSDLDAFIDDNSLSIYDPVQVPVLQIASIGNNVQLSWPAYAVGFDLQENAPLPGATWQVVTNLAIVVSNQFQVILPIQPTNTFYRLAHP